MRDLIGENGTCLEKKCTIEIQGKTFESGGAFIGVDANGVHSGVVYAEWSDHPQTVSNWHGDIKVRACYGPVFIGNWGDKRRYVWFTWKGLRYCGLWAGIDNKQCFSVREQKGGQLV